MSRAKKSENDSLIVHDFTPSAEQASDELAAWEPTATPFTDFAPDGVSLQPLSGRRPYIPAKSRTGWIVAGVIALFLSVIAGVLVANRDRLTADSGKKIVKSTQTKKRESPAIAEKKDIVQVQPMPRRMLAISINQYLYANPVLFGSQTRNVGILLDRLGDKWRIPREQLYLLTDAANSRGSIPPIKPILMESIDKFLTTCRPMDRIALLFAGHATVLDGAAYLVPFDGELNNKESMVPVDWLMRKLQSCPAQQKLFIVDVCRNDPGRGAERPTPGAMDPVLENVLKSPPAGVQVWSACSAKQSSFEFRYQQFDNDEIEGSLFLNQLFNVLFRSGMGDSDPALPLPIDDLAHQVNTLTAKAARGIQSAEQTPFLAGGMTSEALVYDPAIPLAPRITLPKLTDVTKGGLADPAIVKGIFAEIKLPAIKAVNADETSSEPLDAIVPFSADALKGYEPDYETVQQFLDKPDEFPLRVGVMNAIVVLERHGKGDVMVGKKLKHVGLLREEFAGPSSDAVKLAIAKEQQEGPAAMFLELEDLVTMLDKLAPERAKEKSKRWQAHYDYVTAMTKARFAYVNEYNYMLGKIRKDDLPALDPKLHKGWRLASIEKMASPRDVKDKADDARKLFNKLIKENPGTPWEVLAKRERLTALGLTWQPVAVKQ